MDKVAYSGVAEAFKEDGRGRWSRFHLTIFRIVFCFVSLYTLDLIAYFIQGQHHLQNGDYSDPFTAPIWHRLIPWVGLHLLKLAHPVTMHYLVGQDSAYEYILRGTELVLALVAAAVWTLVDHSRRDYRALDAYLRIFVRAVLASEMLAYGLAKVPPAQFGVLTLYRQAQPLGRLWPMAMLWAFMAASPGYTLLCGLVETAGGFLLIPRRTVALGALISAAAMANVLTLNVFYDVNQKIRCLYYLLLTLYLAAPQLVRLWKLLVLQRVTLPWPEPRLPGPRAMRIALSCVPLLFAVLTIVHDVPGDVHRYNSKRHTDSLRSPYYGVWRVNSFTVADPDKPLLSADLMSGLHLAPGQGHWQQLILDAGGATYLQMENGECDYVDAQQDPQTGDTLFSDSGDSSWHARLHFQRTLPNLLAAVGTVNGNPVSMALTQEDIGKNHLTDAPRWISDGLRW